MSKYNHDFQNSEECRKCGAKASTKYPYKFKPKHCTTPDFDAATLEDILKRYGIYITGLMPPKPRPSSFNSLEYGRSAVRQVMVEPYTFSTVWLFDELNDFIERTVEDRVKQSETQSSNHNKGV